MDINNFKLEHIGRSLLAYRMGVICTDLPDMNFKFNYNFGS